MAKELEAELIRIDDGIGLDGFLPEGATKPTATQLKQYQEMNELLEVAEIASENITDILGEIVRLLQSAPKKDTQRMAVRKVARKA